MEVARKAFANESEAFVCQWSTDPRDSETESMRGPVIPTRVVSDEAARRRTQCNNPNVGRRLLRAWMLAMP